MHGSSQGEKPSKGTADYAELTKQQSIVHITAILLTTHTIITLFLKGINIQYSNNLSVDEIGYPTMK